jgi:hypothetical protein
VGGEWKVTNCGIRIGRRVGKSRGVVERIVGGRIGGEQ